MELAPHSDVDLLYLHDGMEEEILRKIISRVNNFLYDSGMQVGHTCRTVDESKDYIDNIQSFHAILDSRFLAGSERLFGRYENEFLKQFPIDLVEAFNEQKISHLERNIIFSHTPLLLTEPNIKNGPLGLRDIQYIYWIEKTKSNPGGNRRNGIYDFFSIEDSYSVVQAYDFLLRTRVHLHKISMKKSDRMDLGIQPDLAVSMGFGEKGLSSLENFVSNYYKAQKDIYFFIGNYIDKYRIQRNKKHNKSFSPVEFEGMKFLRSDDRLYPPSSERLFVNPETLYQDILNVFLFCQSENLEPSPSLLNELRFASSFLDEDFKKNAQAVRIFKLILTGLRSVGKILTYMHESKILGKMIPEFGACTNFPLFSFHHEYPVDEHSLLILRELDQLVDGKFPDPEVQNAFRDCSHVNILYLSLLIHDAGKVKEGDHCQYGAELSNAVSDRLGLDQEEADLFRFLVARHIDMSELSNKRDIFDPKLIEEFSGIVKDQNRLALLYVLTIIDTKSVGPMVLTNWKKDILYKLYESTKKYLKEKQISSDEERDLSGLKGYLTTKENLDEKIVNQILLYADQVRPASYVGYTTNRRILQHFTQLQILKRESGLFALEFEHEPSFTTMTVYSKYRRDLLLHITGAVSSLNLNLVGMRSFRYQDTDDDLLLVQIQLTDSLGSGSIPENTLTMVQVQMRSSLSGEIDLEDLALESSSWTEKMDVPEGLVEEMVHFRNDANDNYTILEIRLPDSIGLLFRVLEILLSYRLEILFARIATSADYAYDSFYLLDSGGEKLTQENLQSEIREKILLRSRRLRSNTKSEAIQTIYF